jgi:outer membrane immunogenic protein
VAFHRNPENNMKRTCLVLGALLCSGAFVPANAADFNYNWPPQGQNFFPTTAFWTGIYVGANIGLGFQQASFANSVGGWSSSLDTHPWLGGGQLGFNYQIGPWVFGGEVDVSAIGRLSATPDAAGFAFGVSPEWTTTATGRIGYAFWRALIYGRAGVAFANDDGTLTIPSNIVGTPTHTALIGWTAGIGIEYAMDQHWSVRLEYDYLGFPDQTLNISFPNLATASGNYTLDIQSITLGFNYRF